MALHGYETAVRFLKDEPWPDDAVSQAVLELYYANALATYARVYSWEIRQRERVETSGELDLKAWDLEQIVEAADTAFFFLWSNRAEWGSEPLGELARYISQNNYPPRIRGTLRDAVAHMWVGLLADIIPVEPGRVEPGLPARRPGVDCRPTPNIFEARSCGCHGPPPAQDRRPARRSRVLARIECSSRSGSRGSARAPAPTACGPDHRWRPARHVSSLEEVQDTFDRSLEWWSMGQAVLAEFVRQGSDPDALVAAREIAAGGPRPPPIERWRPTLQPHRRRHRAAQLLSCCHGGRRPRPTIAPGLPQKPGHPLLPRLAVRSDGLRHGIRGFQYPAQPPRGRGDHDRPTGGRVVGCSAGDSRLPVPHSPMWCPS